VALAIQSVSSNDIHDYVEAIRAGVCTVCHDRQSDGSCETRQIVRCALDAYLLLVVDAIEEATGKTFDRNTLTAVSHPPSAPRPELYSRFLTAITRKIMIVYLAVWSVFALAVIVLLVMRKMVATKEDDNLHMLDAAPATTTQQVTIAHKLDVIDKWGKILTVITVVLGLAIAALYVVSTFNTRGGM
jgi:hypothetical protein